MTGRPAGRQPRTVAVDRLTKVLAGVAVVDDISFVAAPGRVTGFLGPNGAGKTTTLRMLLGLLVPTSGTASIDGRAYGELVAPATVVGASLEGAGFAKGRTGRNHLRCYLRPCRADVRRVEDVLELVGLTGAADRRVGTYSLGMRQRLALATALLGDPDVLVLDEPANGLDPMGVVWLRDFLFAFADAGGTVLVSSHMLAEMQLLVDDVVLLADGSVLFSGPLDRLLDGGRSVVVADGRTSVERLHDVLIGRHHVARLAGGKLLVDASVDALRRDERFRSAVDQLVPAGTELVRGLDLESAFLDLVSRRQR